MSKKMMVVISLIVSVVLYGVISFLTPYNASEKLEEGKVSWEGGVDDKYVYSAITDLEDDDIDWIGRAWVKNSMQQCEYNELITTGVGKTGRIYTTKNKSWVPGMMNKSGYKNIKTLEKDINN